MQKLGIAIFTISIFLEKQEQYFCGANLPGFLRCFRFALTFSYLEHRADFIKRFFVKIDIVIKYIQVLKME